MFIISTFILVSFLGIKRISKLEFLLFGFGIDTKNEFILLCKIWKHTVSIEFNSLISLSSLKTAIPIFSAGLVPDIGEEPDFISESFEKLDWEPVNLEEVTPPKIAYGSQLLHTRAL